MRLLYLLLLLAWPAKAQFWMNQTRFDPRENSQLVHWWDGSFGVSGTITISDLVRGGLDMTASSHQPTLVATSQNGWSCVHFTNSEYANTSSWILIGQNWQFLYAGRVSNPTAAQCVANTTTNTQVVCFTAGNLLSLATAGAQLKTSSSAVSSPGIYSLLNVSCSSGVGVFKQNGTDLGATGTGVQTAAMAYNSLGMLLNSAAFMNGDMLTCLQYSTGQSGNAFNKATNYVRTRFNF